MTARPVELGPLAHNNETMVDDEDVWDMMDALYPGRAQHTDDSEVDIFAVLDGTAFGGQLSLQPIPESGGSWEDVDIPHLPDLSIGAQNGESSKTGRTSEPLAKSGHEEKESVVELVSYDRFQEFISTPIGLLRFSQWVEEEGSPGSISQLRCYQDASAYIELVNEMQALTRGMDSVYFGKQPGHSVSKIPPHRSVCTSSLTSASLGMQKILEESSTRLFETEFKRFLAGSITEHARSRLGMSISSVDRGNLGEVFCLADPRLPDQPLVYVSDQFCELTEYPRNRILGRNCRFLQGPATDKAAVQLLRDAITAGKEHCSLILNYTRTGKPFWNLLHMIPLRGSDGKIEYFMGAQINVTKALTSPDAFTALSRLSQQGWMHEGGSHDAIKFSHRVMAAAESELRRPLALRDMSQDAIRPGYLPTPSQSEEYLGSSTSEPEREPRRRLSKMFSFSSTKAESSIPMKDYPSTQGLEPFHQTQPVAPALREHMSAFSSTYAKMMVLDSETRIISYITPPLLHMLGYSVRNPSDRFISSLKGSDLIDIIAGATAEDSHAARMTVRSVMGKQATHSFFTGLYTSTGRSTSSTDRSKTERSHDGKAFTRVLLHLTPMGGIKGDMRYVVVVG